MPTGAGVPLRAGAEHMQRSSHVVSVVSGGRAVRDGRGSELAFWQRRKQSFIRCLHSVLTPAVAQAASKDSPKAR
jgi:hypothetical protein